MAKSSPQAIWGGVQFTVDTLAIDGIDRDTEFRLSQQDRLGDSTNWQFIGPGTQKITIKGEANHLIGGSMFQTDKLISIGSLGKPKNLVIGPKNVGKFLLQSIKDGFGNIVDDGRAITNKFTLTLVRQE